MLYVLSVTTGKELMVKERLKELGIKSLVPLSFKYRRTKGKWTEETAVVFKGYVFINIHYNAENYYKVTEIDNVIKFLRADGIPIELSYIEEEYIKLLSSDEFLLPSVVKEEDGELLIISPLLKKFETKITKIDKHKRVAEFEIMLLGKAYKVVNGIDIV